MGSRPIENKKYHKIRPSQFEIVDGGVIVEKPISLSVNGKIWLTFMCTPTDLEALGVGFLFNEGLLDTMDDIRMVELHHNQHMIEVWLNKDVEKPTDWRLTSGCTGGITAVSERSEPLPSPNGEVISIRNIIEITKDLFENQRLYQKVRGVHATALSDGEQNLIVCEDIGRHNTLDKIAGLMLLDSMDLRKRVLVTSGRVSSEMLQKAIRMKAGVVISRTSPTTLSVKLAEENNVTLIGYARGRQFNIYSHPEWVILPQ
jgi:FdhD protein